jgi:hypothetical protein
LEVKQMRKKGDRRKSWPAPEEIDRMDASPIRKALLQQRRSVEDGAKLLELSPTWLSQILRGSRQLSDELAFKAEELLGVPFMVSKRWHYDVMKKGRKVEGGAFWPEQQQDEPEPGPAPSRTSAPAPQVRSSPLTRARRPPESPSSGAKAGPGARRAS